MSLTATFWIVFPAGLAAAVIIVRLSLCRRRQRKENLALRRELETIFEFVHDVGEVFAEDEDISTDALLTRILFFAVKTAGASAGAIYLFNSDRTRLFARAVSGVFPPLYDAEQVKDEQLFTTAKSLETCVKTRPVAAGEGIIGIVAEVGTGIIIEDAELDARTPNYTAAFLKIRTLMAVPMRFGNEVLGAIVLINRVDGQLFTAGDLMLHQAMTDQASVPVHYAGLRAALEEKRILDRSMQTARQIQASLLPQTLPEIDSVSIAAYNLPAFDIGGDYYDVIELGNHLLGIAIADVSGKGIAGAMMMAVCQGVLRARAPLQHSPALMLSELNNVLSANLAEDMFITMLYMVINTETRAMKFARAGHERPLLKRTGSINVEMLDGNGIAIGLADSEIFNTAIEDVCVQLEPGDTVVLFTDGINEALDNKNKEWGINRLKQVIDQRADDGVDQLIQTIREQLARHVGAQPQYDDMTLVAVAVK
ncbi:MAG: GAF domain-containing SpoIIE family protein phosphatase [Kiritimatiellales bacterium]